MRSWLTTLPEELLTMIENLLNMDDLVKFYTSRNLVIQYNKLMPHLISILSKWKIKKRKYCAQCKHDTLTCVEWKNNLKRDWIPWCTLHSNPCLLNDIEVYCIGSLDLEGVCLVGID